MQVGTLRTLLELLAYYVFLYPLAMSVVWAIGGLYFWWRRERKSKRTYDQSLPQLNSWPPVTVLVPCKDEAAAIDATCHALRYLDYPDYRVVIIDDASTDGTPDIIRRWVSKVPIFHLMRLTENVGKARALNLALDLAVSTPVTVVMDADTLLAPQALKWLVAPFTRQPRLGAVTGNPIVFNRGNLLEKMQAAEFASIIGLIKRSQRVFGRVLTVSGCITAYRTELLQQIGGFSPNTATEDIEITWQIERRFWEVWFEPRAVAFIQAPSTLKGFWKQRCRWALGGWHLLRKHKDIFVRWQWRRLWPVYIEFVLGYAWAFCFVIGSLGWFIGYVLFHTNLSFSPLPAWYGALVSVACVAQFCVALAVNHAYDKKLWRTLFWIPWYPLFFFVFGALAVIWTSPRGIFGTLEEAGRWDSPSRIAVSQKDVTAT
jgi:biofilm PGA synthesis N-glycosyltransferase PgaC